MMRAPSNCTQNNTENDAVMITRALKTTAATVGLSLLLLSSAQAARPILPPLTEFTGNPYNLVMAGQAVEKIAPNKVRFERQEAFAGDVQASVVLRLDEETFADLQVDQTYIVAYTYVTSDPQFRESKYEDPEGPRMITVRGYGSPALFEDTPDMRFLFESVQRDDPPMARDVLEALTRQMARADTRTRALAVVELLLRRDLLASMRPQQAERVATLVTDPAVDQELRAFLLEVAVAFPDRSQRWLRDACREVLAQLEPQFVLETHGPALATATIRAIADHGSSQDVQALVPFLQSNAPKVVTAAIESIEVLLLRDGRAAPSR